MALTLMAMRRNQPKVQARDSWAAGMTNSATFRPGEKRETSETGIVDSLVMAQASARNPTSKPSMAGKIQRKNECFGIRRDSIKTYGVRRSRHALAGEGLRLPISDAPDETISCHS